MVEITDDDISIGPKDNSIRFVALGGPDDPVRVESRITSFELTKDDLEEFHQALMNFRNTGFFTWK